MSTRVTDYKEALDHLPEGGMLVFDDVSWEEYEELLEQMEDRPGCRVTYDEGKLEIMSPRPEHEKYRRVIERIIDTASDELDINVESFGSATWKRKPHKGAEGDTCYYVANAERIIGKNDIDITKDPPPDLLVEVDSTSGSIDKFGIHAAFRIPEIWRYDVKHNIFHMYELRGRKYAEISSSRSFPVLTPKIMVEFIDFSKTQGQKKALTAFRQWLKKSR
jgi:Uma2 family endonuclease